ncbi:MAG: hypothetical protein ACRYGK_07090 [Janthinobacterium lividum]
MAIHFHKKWLGLCRYKNGVTLSESAAHRCAHSQYLILAINSQFGIILQFFAFLTSFIAMGSLKRNIYFKKHSPWNFYVSMPFSSLFNGTAKCATMQQKQLTAPGI